MEEDTGAIPRKEDFSSWYNEILWRAEIMDVRYPVKGLYVWYPYGFGIRKRAYAILREIMDRDHAETMFPLLIPKTEFMKEAEHIKGLRMRFTGSPRRQDRTRRPARPPSYERDCHLSDMPLWIGRTPICP